MQADWNKGCFDDGYKARLDGSPRSIQPHDWSDYALNSWLAGWDASEADSKTDPNYPDAGS